MSQAALFNTTRYLPPPPDILPQQAARSVKSRGQRAGTVAGVGGVMAEFDSLYGRDPGSALTAPMTARSDGFPGRPQSNPVIDPYRSALPRPRRTTCACLMLAAAARTRDTRPRPRCAIGTPRP